MADITLYGHIEGIRYKDKSVLVTLSEYRKGYKRGDGVIVDDEVATYIVVFKEYFKRYIAEHFDAHMLVKIKGTMLPYAKDKDGNYCNGYTILGETINIASMPNRAVRSERKLLKESQSHAVGTPNLSEFEKEDF